MEAADQRGHHMAVGGMVVIVGAVQVGGHHADVVGAILAVQELAVFQAADFSQSISFVGFFQLAGQQAVFLHGLRCHARVNAGGAQKFQLFAAVFPCGMNHVHFQRHVVIHKVRQSVLVGNNAAHLGCGQKDIFRLFGGKKFFHGILAAQVQLFMGPGNDIGISLAFQFPHNGGTYHTAVACHIDLSVLFHHNKWPSFLFYDAFSRYSSRLQRMFSSARSTATFSMSCSTMILTSSSKLVLVGFQPSSWRALVGSPHRLTTSVGR